MTYSDAIEFLYDLRLFGLKLGLHNTFRLAALVCNPQDKLRFIHVAGTNGKGSTCAMLESIYRAAGLRVGLFTSPHLVSFRERIQRAVARWRTCRQKIVAISLSAMASSRSLGSLKSRPGTMQVSRFGFADGSKLHHSAKEK